MRIVIRRLEMRFKDIHKSFLRDDQGSVAIITAVVLAFVLLGTAALAIDIGRQTSAKNELQNAVDAAAFSGAIELAKNGNSNVATKANETAQKNMVDNNSITLSSGDVKIGSWNEPNFENLPPYNAVNVTVNNHSIGSFFAPLFGMSQRVSASATAVVGPAGGMEKLIPIGIQEEVYLKLLDDPLDPEYRLVTKDNFGEIGPGNWGWVDLAEAYDESASTIERTDWIINGYPKMIFVGDEITTDTGANLTTPARTEVHNKLTEYIDNETVLYIPIICNTWSSGSSATVTIMGFAPIVITAYGGQAANFWIEAEFPEGSHVGAGPIDFGGTDFGILNIALVE